MDENDVELMKRAVDKVRDEHGRIEWEVEKHALDEKNFEAQRFGAESARFLVVRDSEDRHIVAVYQLWRSQTMAHKLTRLSPEEWPEELRAPGQREQPAKDAMDNITEVETNVTHEKMQEDKQIMAEMTKNMQKNWDPRADEAPQREMRIVAAIAADPAKTLA